MSNKWLRASGLTFETQYAFYRGKNLLVETLISLITVPLSKPILFMFVEVFPTSSISTNTLEPLFNLQTNFAMFSYLEFNKVASSTKLQASTTLCTSVFKSQLSLHQRCLHHLTHYEKHTFL